MSVQTDYVQLAGGLDEAVGFTTPRAGRLIGTQNFEVTFGSPGYRRIAGYERFDGRTAPSIAEYHTLPFSTGTSAIAPGDTVTGPSGSGVVLLVVLSSGTWAGGNAAGTLVLTALTGTFSAGQALQVGAAPRATATAGATLGAVGDTDYKARVQLARTHYRNQIGRPPGEGAILGVFIYRGVVYCLRNIVGGASATLWASSSGGWTAVRTGLRPGGTMRSVRAGFTGLPGDTGIYAVDGKNRPWRLQGATFSYLPAIYPTEGTSSTSITPGLGSRAFTTSESGRAWTAGQVLRVVSASNAANFMVGTVTTSTASSVTINVTSFGGTTATDWHICREDGVDRPFNLAAHKNHLFLAYPQGQLQHSNLGDPTTYTSTAGVIALGDEIVDVKTLRADVLCITQASRISLLYGSSKLDWELRQHSESSGARFGSTQEVGGNAIFLSDSGIMSLAGSDAFGDFDAANLGQDVQRSLRTVMQAFRCVSLIKSDSQYRIYGGDGSVLVMTWFGGTPTQRNVVFTRLAYAHVPSCSTWDTIADDEYVIFGTEDGWVMRERIGTTFDGAAIDAFFRTSYWHFRSPMVRKRMRKIVVDCDAIEPVQIQFKLDFDFAGPGTPSSDTATVEPSGGYYDQDNWNEFFWSNADAAQLEAYVPGVGKFISLMVWCAEDSEPFRIYGMGVQYSPLELAR
ncbi:hypothetical protein UFOVP707_42 [uncultured Caudovirales phage]|uniref:Uncharacterized protein n=1 Tax=uncultured Caudovirales phage TaxID=2100421 RepID=A0A6J5NPR8_9CAUD|nr:hypothetical protein UFOVP707_42 [uncultured Caudovirales phage]